jgi:hypothetical protein
MRSKASSNRPTCSLATAAVRVAGSLAVALNVGGCSLVQSITAPSDEYAAYRGVRTARRVEDRLKASDAYLEKYPQGQWRQDVRPWFERAEAKYYARREDNAVGLAEYLEVLPHGPHADSARRELARHRARTAEGRNAQLVYDARYTEARLSELARQRESARDMLGAWVGRLLTIRAWGERTSALDHEFIFAWRIDKPAGRCVDDWCAKLVELPFELPGGGDEAKRELDFEVVLSLRAGMVSVASLQGPGMFSRLYEAARSKPVVAGDAVARIQAIAFAREFIGGAAEATLPAARCAAEDVGRVVLKRACDGLTMEVIAAEDAAEDDAVVVSGPSH